MIICSNLINYSSIALMSDSYERIQDQAALEQQRLRAGLLLELEISIGEKDRKDTTKFPPYLHVLIPKGHDETKFDGGSLWPGVLGAIKGAPEARKPEMRERATQCLDRAERIKQERELRRAAPRFGSPFPYADGCERC
jgi:hypothetical protein